MTMMLRGQKERCQAALRSSACRVDSSSSRSSSSSSDGSHSVHRHSKVLMSGLRERNAYSLENKATMSRNSHLIQTYTGHAGDSATSWRDHYSHHCSAFFYQGSHFRWGYTYSLSCRRVRRKGTYHSHVCMRNMNLVPGVHTEWK